ncbi:MAG TPA: hypothetical protein VM263_01060, partial [Acidimicrobiales bacterium]|nr:hypothetical protein [Acidimicrobiales bacterium]
PETLPRVVRREAPLSLAAVALFALLVQDGLTRAEGGVLVAALVVAVVVMLRAAGPDDPGGRPEPATEELVIELGERIEGPEEADLAAVAAAPTRRDVGRVVAGLGATVAGAHVLVVGAQRVAEDLGLSGGFVGLTLVAVGTSLPELVTAVQSARRGETALLAGNVLGSNVFNSTAVGGAAALVGPGVVADAGLTVVGGVSMVLVAALAWLFLGLGGRLSRADAVVLLGIYAGTLALV